MKRAWAASMAAALTLIAQAAVAPAQSTTGAAATIEVDFLNPGLSPSHWTLTLHPDGSGHFVAGGGKGMGADDSDIVAMGVDRDIQLSKEFAEHVFAVARQQKLFNEPCESRLKVAFQGTKTLKYSGPDGAGSCSFNYSKNRDIENLGDSMVAVAGTIMEGQRLELLLVHDPLGLDREIDFLVQAAKDGRAQQLCVIRGILTRLADDPAVLNHVRERAGQLLADSKS
ncbi:MAG TPA: hypothetical protein VMA34_21835 [Terracidiphilus sp.]|nr:hypothetical protein [Terracidiphilus sp.]